MTIPAPAPVPVPPPAPAPALTVRRDPVDLSAAQISVAAPFLLDLRVAPDEMSTVVDHVSNVEYVRWLDRAAELHADALGWTRAKLLTEGLMWFVARHEIDYAGEARLGDELVIATWIRSTARVKSWRDYVIFRPADEKIVCRASTLWVLVRLASRRPARIPPDMVASFNPPPGQT